MGYKPSALVVNIVSAAWTLASELILAISRYVSPGAFLTTYLLEMAVLLVTTILWLGKSHECQLLTRGQSRGTSLLKREISAVSLIIYPQEPSTKTRIQVNYVRGSLVRS